MRIESSVTSISWIPSEAVEGLPKLPFTFGVAHYDDPPPDRVDHIETMHRADLFREANELKAWVEVEGGKIVDHGHAGRGRIGLTRLKLGSKDIAVPAVAMPTLQDTEVGDGWVRFTQTAGGRTGMPAPRSVRGKPYFQINSAIAWTTLALTIRADGTSEYELAGASTFPRHWIYDSDGGLVQKSGVIDFGKWYREAHEQNTPWGKEDSAAVVTAVESLWSATFRWRSCAPKGSAARSACPPGTSSSNKARRVRARTSCTSCSTVCSRSSSTVKWLESLGQERSSASVRSSRTVRERRACARRQRRRSLASPARS
jgi:hypothetical protein